ncbi:MAG: glycine/sarcosine/betaine reductase component B subunit [Eubacteriales bacterium]|jgi:D-proline reductase (dithiol) PrdD
MGLGPSMKMTTLHHYRCPLTAELAKQDDISFAGILIDGVSELCDDKIFTAKRTAEMAAMMQADGAIVTVDGFGNHHVDFVNVIEQLGRRGIPAVGVSFFGEQGKLVCTGDYLDCLIDINKTSSGFETCVVGQNNLTPEDAYKAVGLLKYRMKKAGKKTGEKVSGSALQTVALPAGNVLVRHSFPVHEVRFGEKTAVHHGVLEIRQDIRDRAAGISPDIHDVQVRILPPGLTDDFVNANLDFFPVACKISGEPGEGETNLLTGMTVMLSGVEEESGFQPANIGSSCGSLREHLVTDRAGTPAADDFLLHIDVLFRNGAGRTAEGILAAHQAADMIAEEIRRPLAALMPADEPECRTETFTDTVRGGAPRAVLIKIVSGLGAMYDTALFPSQPCGILGARLIRKCGCIPWAITPNQCRDGVIHSLI